MIIGSQDNRRGLGLYDLRGNQLRDLSEGSIRVNALAVSPDGHRLVVLLQKRILIYNLDAFNKVAEYMLRGFTNFTSVSISKDSKYMLVSGFGLEDSAIKLMHIDTGAILQTYDGHQHRGNVIRSSFGGADENFVISGSEGKLCVSQNRIRTEDFTDSKVYIWRTSGKLIAAYEGHEGGCVNAAAWHPKNPSVFATAGDDKTVKIWMPDELPTPSQDHANVVSSCNGFSK